MEVINLKKNICLLLIFALSLQSCSVYKNKSVTFDEAVAKKCKVKVTRVDGDTDVFDRIEKVDTTYYGLQKNDKEYERTVVKENDYVKVQPKNKPVSTLATVGVVVMPFVIVLGVLQLIDVH